MLHFWVFPVIAEWFRPRVVVECYSGLHVRVYEGEVEHISSVQPSFLTVESRSMVVFLSTRISTASPLAYWDFESG